MTEQLAPMIGDPSVATLPAPGAVKGFQTAALQGFQPATLQRMTNSGMTGGNVMTMRAPRSV